MLWLALRFGTTHFMEPSESQLAGDAENGIAPLEWKGDDAAKVRSLIESFLSSLHERYPTIKSARYDFGAGQFLDRRGVPVLGGSDQGFDKAAKSERGRQARAGEATLRRGIFLQSLVSSEGGKGPELLEQLLSRGRPLTDSGLSALFSSPAPDLKEITQQAITSMPPIYGRVFTEVVKTPPPSIRSANRNPCQIYANMPK